MMSDIEKSVSASVFNGTKNTFAFTPQTEHKICFSEKKAKDKLTFVDLSQTPSLQPVCIYMREEVTGEYALKETKLRNLGLTGGRAVIR